MEDVIEGFAGHEGVRMVEDEGLQVRAQPIVPALRKSQNDRARK